MKLLIYLAIIYVLTIKDSESVEIYSKFSNKTSTVLRYFQKKGQNLKDFSSNTKTKMVSAFDELKRKTKTKIVSAFDQMKKSAKSSASSVFDLFKNKFKDAERSFKNIKLIKKRNATEQYDPSDHFTTPELIAAHGYPSESHVIVTDDGYILTIHRIPHSRNKTRKLDPRKTVLLHHGLLGSSADWVIPGPDKGLAYILSDAGYDVWLANVRGNTYSRAHISRNVDSYEFWNFSFHEVSQHDLPVVIDYITTIKGGVKIDYIGHSMGTTILFALLSTKPEYNDKLRAGFALAPVAYMSKIKSPISMLAPFSDDLAYLMKLLGANEFLPQNKVLSWLSKYACEINHYAAFICENSMFVFSGYDEKQFNLTLLPLILTHVPAGASTKTVIHYAQEIANKGNFQMFDYGSKENFLRYGSVIPPKYPITNITLPIALFSAENDWLASEDDVKNLYKKLSNPIEHYIVPLKEFNHIDFLWAIDAPTLVYKRLLHLLHEGLENNWIETMYDNDIKKYF